MVGRVVWGFLPLLPAAVHHCAAEHGVWRRPAPPSVYVVRRQEFYITEYEHAGDTMPWCTPDSDMLRGIAQL